LASSSLFREPIRRLEEARQTGDSIEESLSGLIERRLEQLGSTINHRSAQIASAHPGHRLIHAGQRISSLREQLGTQLSRRLDREKGRVDRIKASLSALNPDATLARGFSITRNAAGKVVTSPDQLEEGDHIVTQLAQGEIGSVVEKKGE
jgi:exodeoxyribonuclease VII large subunit